MSDYITVEEALENAPGELVEKDVEGVFGGKVRIKALTASQAARVKQVSINLAGKNPDVVWSAMEITQFELGVVQPKFDHEQVVMLHRQSGPSFAKVIAELDAISGTSKEEFQKAQAAFPVGEE